MARARASVSSRRSRNAWSCACSTSRVTRNAWTCPSGPATCGTATCPGSAPASAMATVCTAPGIRHAVLAVTRASCCSTHTPAPSTVSPLGRRIHAHVPGHPFVKQEDDSAPDVPRSLVVHDDYDWGQDVPPHLPDNEMVIYETHVKGFTQQHPGMPAELRGTYAGLAQPAAIDHLRASASRRWSCCRSTTSSMMAFCWSAACGTTGVTTPSASSLRTPNTPRAARLGNR